MRYLTVSGYAGSYPYAYGLVSGKHVKLLKPRNYEEFAISRGVEEIVASLEGGEYEEELESVAGKTIDIRALESALSRHFLRIQNEVLAAIPDKERGELAALFSEERDMKNIKTLLRGAYSNASREEVVELMEPPGSIGLEELGRIAGGGGVEDAIEKLNSPYTHILKASMEKYHSSKNLRPLITAIDLEYVRRITLAAEASGCEDIKAFVRMQKEAIIVRNLLRAQKDNVRALGRLIGEGHYLTRKEIEGLGRDHDISGVLKHTPYSKLLAPGGKNPESGVERIIADALKETALMRPLGLVSEIAFIKAKEIEVRNLRALLICKHQGLDPETINSLII